MSDQNARNPRVALRPFDKNKDKPRVNNDGSISTEVTRTVKLPDGSWANVPTLWFADGKLAQDIGKYGDDVISGFAQVYENGTGAKFPRYGTLEEAVTSAQSRSLLGGGTKNLLAVPIPIKPYGVR